ncbi:MAG: hypothetical protein IKN56_06885, partial [Clostridia bacterium]|nr:hypothetical protein [Clostridia bacterium]
NDQDSDDSQTALLDADYTDEASETTILDSDIETEDDEGETSLLSGYSYADNSDDGETTFLNSTDTQDEEGSETTVLSVFNGVELENLSDYDEDYAETTLLSVRQSGEWAETIRIIDEITFVSLNELID